MTDRPEEIPAEAQARRLEQVYQSIAELVGRPEVAQRLGAASSADDWSVLQVLGHMGEMIPYWLAHCRTLIAAAEPPFFGRTLDSPERLEAVARSSAAEPQALLQQLQAEVRSAAAFIRALTPEQRSRKGLHNRQGEVTVAAVVEGLIVRHAEEHLEQIRVLLQA